MDHQVMNQNITAQKGTHRIKPKTAPLKKKPGSSKGSIVNSAGSLSRDDTHFFFETIRGSSKTLAELIAFILNCTSIFHVRKTMPHYNLVSWEVNTGGG